MLPEDCAQLNGAQKNKAKTKTKNLISPKFIYISPLSLWGDSCRSQMVGTKIGCVLRRIFELTQMEAREGTRRGSAKRRLKCKHSYLSPRNILPATEA